MSKTLILKLKEDKLPRLIILSKTRYIDKEDTEIHFAWEYLKDGYNQIEKSKKSDDMDKKMHSILNSIVYQQRIYFCFERDNTRKLLKADKNWKKPITGLSNGEYSHIIEEFCRKEIIKLHDDTKKPHIYKVIHPEVLSMIKVDDEETQLSQVIEFVEKNKGKSKTDGKTDGKTDVDKEINRKEEKESESEPENNNCLVENDSPKKKLITFEQLLFREYPESFPSFDDIPYLAQIAVENCEDFDAGYSNLAKFEQHLKSQAGSKPTKKQKNFITMLVDTFSFEAKKAYSLVETDGIELRQPTELKAKSIRQEVDKEEQIQNNTLNVIKSTYGQEKIKKLKARIESCEDEIKIAEMKAELAYWEKTN